MVHRDQKCWSKEQREYLEKTPKILAKKIEISDFWAKAAKDAKAAGKK
jgi:hypothetical protein